MIKQILVKDFSNFTNRMMVPLINTAADTLVENLEVYADSGQSFDIHQCLGCFTMDVIASVAFGTQVDSQKNPENPFVKHAKIFFSFTLFRPLLLVFIAFPFLIDPLVRIVPNKRRDQLNNFFIGFIKNMIKQREEQPPNELMLDVRSTNEYVGVENFDVVNHADEGGSSNATPKKTQKRMLTEDEIMGQAFIFLLAGYETTSSTLAFAAYLLAIHQECQEKLQREVDEFYARHCLFKKQISVQHTRSLYELQEQYDNQVIRIPRVDWLQRGTI
ncbi:Thromboxane-A synthase [Acipenser ruthenus]|uniref:Thromboxane-A synthase n=1 Tax=Acipenser ruthenus TaxID=7906 RepID=A0A444UK29_ACIRT|nr:Thromboxane-A synthase [Acipenser ruthenus]